MKTVIDSLVKHLIVGICLLIVPIMAFSQSENWANYEGKEMISNILKDGNSLWIATNSDLLQVDMETEKFTHHILEGIPDLPLLRNLIKDNDGNLWITTQRSGVVKYDGQRILEHYNTSDSSLITDQYCTSIAIDSNNNKWIGSLLYLNKFDGNEWQRWTTPESAVASHWFIYDLKFDHNGDLWLGGDSHEWYFAIFTGQEIQPVPEITQPVTRILIDKDNNKWLASLHGLIKYDGAQFVTWNAENSDLPANDIYDIRQDVSGNIWLACNKYLVRFDGSEFTNYTNPLLTDSKDFILCLEVDNSGNIWSGTKLSGLFKFTQEQKSFQRLNSPAAIKTVLVANNDFLIHSAGSKQSFDFLLTDAASVSLSVFDIQGKEVVSLLKNHYLPGGNHQYSAHLKTGIYLVKYVVNGNVNVKKIIARAQ
jgi:ligand-binding sensor domain-containing protein